MLTILWHDEESNGNTDLIPSDWLTYEDGHKGVIHKVRGPRSGQSKAKCDVTVCKNIVELNYEPYADFNTAAGALLGVLRIQFADESRERITQVFWKKNGQTQFAPYSTTVSFVADDAIEFDALVAASKRLSAEKRQARLDSAPKKPTRMQVVSTTFKRNPDVVAAVHIRAKGHCEGCSSPAPFKCVKDGTPYLEVHHRVPLSDGGDDTVENAVALCPNCHRKSHYG